MKEFRPAKKRINVSVGEAVRIIRELQGLTQTQLAELSGIPHTTVSAIENDRVRLGVERTKVLARALKCHPTVLVFPAPSPFVRGLGEGPRRPNTLSPALSQREREEERSRD